MRKAITALAAAATLTGVTAGGASAATYEVQQGDSLWSISHKQNISVDQLKSWNSLSSNMIYPGEKLEVSTQADSRYTVKKGDTLWKISRSYGVTVSDLMEWNKLTSDLIHPGDSLSVKEGARQKVLAEKSTQASVQPQPQPQPQQSEGKVMTVTATAYTANCEGCSGVTATGIDLNANPNQKVIAVDPKVIPLGSKVFVEGYGTAIAGDVGGAIKGNRIDVFVPDETDAKNFGVKQVNITVLN